ncbi:hypothetical protein ALP33_102824 [Pseudomonas amygdali pv. lachrymans]|uniref:Uncharacterized protein n=1 Tax=Pseudomonas amygdali pv. lachrymans TaxID=53707 RepID=A0AB37R9N3_PSEAV|nr:Unknown protein sequence [Pseudomonas amygdali pv. lachrymans]KPC16081.1 Unknown protein sequence [Pseudomonas amygdali pv. lachrymans]RMM48530.1 hypothetical protein ALQ79_102834 [Pseudomonas amygdali pv. lachrymans]RMP16238.1 hypothetical protein ALQ26_103267 [Pseudomonas amygdali pv. lachrymans]RMT09554.1 hypothetical protein ALP54_102757 [Pseudomonas amygdali pv. lachrymans]
MHLRDEDARRMGGQASSSDSSREAFGLHLEFEVPRLNSTELVRQ